MESKEEIFSDRLEQAVHLHTLIRSFLHNEHDFEGLNSLSKEISDLLKKYNEATNTNSLMDFKQYLENNLVILNLPQELLEKIKNEMIHQKNEFQGYVFDLSNKNLIDFIEKIKFSNVNGYLNAVYKEIFKISLLYQILLDSNFTTQNELNKNQTYKDIKESLDSIKGLIDRIGNGNDLDSLIAPYSEELEGKALQGQEILQEEGIFLKNTKKYFEKELGIIIKNRIFDNSGIDLSDLFNRINSQIQDLQQQITIAPSMEQQREQENDNKMEALSERQKEFGFIVENLKDLQEQSSLSKEDFATLLIGEVVFNHLQKNSNIPLSLELVQRLTRPYVLALTEVNREDNKYETHLKNTISDIGKSNKGEFLKSHAAVKQQYPEKADLAMEYRESIISDVEKYHKEVSKYSSRDLAELDSNIIKLQQQIKTLEGQGQTLSSEKQENLYNANETLLSYQAMKKIIQANVAANTVLLDFSGSSTFLKKFHSPTFTNLSDLKKIEIPQELPGQQTKPQQRVAASVGQEDTAGKLQQVAAKLTGEDAAIYIKDITPKQKIAIAVGKDGIVKDITRLLKDQQTMTIGKNDKTEAALLMATLAIKNFKNDPKKLFFVRGKNEEQKKLVHAALVFLMCDENGKVKEPFKQHIETIKHKNSDMKASKSWGSYNKWIQTHLGEIGEKYLEDLKSIRSTLHEGLFENKEVTQKGFIKDSKKQMMELRDHKISTQTIETPGVEDTNSPSPGNGNRY